MRKGGKAGLILITITLLVAMIIAWQFYPMGAAFNAADETVAVAPATKPAIAGPNAAEKYREAIELIAPLQADPQAMERLRAYDQGTFDEAAAGLFEKYAQALALVHTAAGIARCDWGEMSMEARLAHLGAMRQLLNLTFAHARFAGSRKDSAAMLDDLLAAMGTARHIGAGAMITDMQVVVAMETRAIDRLAAELGSLGPDQLRLLSSRLDGLPRAISGREMIDTESAFAGKSVAQQGGGMIVSGMSRGLQEFYGAMASVIDKQTPADFTVTVNTAMSKHRMNSFVQLHGPTLIRMRQSMAELEAKRAMLPAAIEITLKGEAAVGQSKDPFGEGPFGYAKAGDGFELISRIANRGGAVKLTVGGK